MLFLRSHYTRKDSDGGAWRKRTQNTSWYNETLGTATRGTRKEFPAVAVIVAESNPNRITIYDGDDPDLPMWMVFPASTSATANFLAVAGQPLSSVVILNGELCIGFPSANGWGVGRISFVKDSQKWYWTSAKVYHQIANSIAERNVESGYIAGHAFDGLVNALVNDIAITVLPNAPIDPSTGLPVPTIAVAADGGMSVIKDDGIVVDTTSSNSGYTHVRSVEWASNGDLLFVMGNSNGYLDYLHTYDGFNVSDNVISIDTKNGSTKNVRSSFRHADTTTAYASHQYDGFTVRGSDAAPNYAQLHPVAKKDPFEYGVRSPQGLTHISENPDSKGSLVAYTNTTHNTGWMHGDIKGAFLADTDTTNVTGSELITNGTFDSNTTGWGAGNGATLTQQSNGNPGGNINVLSGASSNGYAYQTNTTVVGKYYTLSFDHYHVNGSQGYVNIGTSLGGSQYVYKELGTSSSWTTYSFTIKATTTSTFTGFYSRPNGNVRYDNISLREADPDRSMNNNGAQVFGTVTKTAVATGAELVAYSGFSNSDYLRQPHNTDLEIGTGEISISAWFKSSTSDTANYKGLFYLNNPGSLGPGLQVLFSPSNGIYLYVYGASGSQNFDGSYQNGYNDGHWHQVVVSTKPGQQQIYVDGVLKETGNVNTGSMTNTSSEIYIGRWYGNTSSAYYWRGDIALVRVSRSIPSPEQIKKMYEDEKHLFQENAKATLYGSSDAVTALAYDDTTNLLHVGTSAGRSEFQGLRRINNTTTAVITAISASNGLVAEQ